ncbi:hypothetical protein MMC26_006076 [Xylographa opegraphella]|nr:hypothetical protein [Xylographa opegraphella]
MSATQANKEMTLSQGSSYNTPRWYSKPDLTSTQLTDNTGPDSQADGTTASNFLEWSEPMSTPGASKAPNPLTMTPKSTPTSKQYPCQLSEVEQILEKLGHPRILVEIQTRRKAVTREDLLLSLREEVRTIRTNLGLEAWDEDEETNRQPGTDVASATGDTEPRDTNSTKAEKLQLAGRDPRDDCENAGCTSMRDCQQPARQPTLETSSVANDRVSRKRPIALDLRNPLMP